MRETCLGNNEIRSTIHPKNAEQDERLIRKPIKSDFLETKEGNVTGTKTVAGLSSDDCEIGGADEDDAGEGTEEDESDKGEESQGIERGRKDRQEQRMNTDTERVHLSKEDHICRERKVEHSATAACQILTQAKLANATDDMGSGANVGQSPRLGRKRKLDSVGSGPLDDRKEEARVESLQQNRISSHCCLSSGDGHSWGAPCPGSRKRMKHNHEDINEALNIADEEFTDDDYGGVDEVDFSEDEAQLAMLEERYIINSELTKRRERRGSMAIGGPRQSLTETDFPELFGNSDDSVPTFTSDAGFLYETAFSSSRNELDGTAKRVRFEENTRMVESVIQVFDGSDSEPQSDVSSDHAAPHTSFMIPQSSASNDALGQGPLAMGIENLVEPESNNGSRVNFAQSASTSEYDASELSDGSTNFFDSDDGDTTDEEDPPAHAHIHNPHSKLHQRLSPTLSDVGPNSKMISTRSSRRNGPVMGHFVVDPRKAVVVLDDKKLKLFPARLPRTSRSSTDSSDSLNSGNLRSITQTHDMPTRNPLELFGATPLDVMLCGVFGPNSGFDTLRGQVIGPPEAFYPFTTIAANGTIASNDDDIYDHENTDENMMNLHELIDFGNASDTDLGRDTSTELVNGALGSQDVGFPNS